MGLMYIHTAQLVRWMDSFSRYDGLRLDYDDDGAYEEHDRRETIAQHTSEAPSRGVVVVIRKTLTKKETEQDTEMVRSPIRVELMVWSGAAKQVKPVFSWIPHCTGQAGNPPASQPANLSYVQVVALWRLLRHPSSPGELVFVGPPFVSNFSPTPIFHISM